MSAKKYKQATDPHLTAEVRDWDTGDLNTDGWVDASEAVPNQARSTAISIRMPNEMLSILKMFAERNGVGYQVLIKRWLDKKIREERDLLRLARKRDSIR